MKSIRSNTWVATILAALWTYFDDFHKEVNFNDYFFHNSIEKAFQVQRRWYFQGLQPYAIREAIINLVITMVIYYHKAMNKHFIDIVISVKTCHSPFLRLTEIIKSTLLTNRLL